MAEEYDYLFKSIVVGDGGVGKTALTLRFSKGFFTEDYKMTIGVDFHVKTITIDAVEKPIRAKLQIWDTGGQERFSSIRPMYYRGSLGALLIFDLTNSGSFEHLPQWIEEIRANVKTEIPLLLVGNKSDLIDQRAVSLEELNSFTNTFNLYYMETSAKTGDGVGDCFYILACLMIGSEVPDQLVSNGIVYTPGKIPVPSSQSSESLIPQLDSEYDYAAPPVPDPPPIETYQSKPTFETEPEFDYAAPPVPEPSPIETYENSSTNEPEYEPEIPIPEPPIEKSEKQPAEFIFKTPGEILSDETSQEQITHVSESTVEEPYKPKAAPFTSNVPIPAPIPKDFQAFQETKSLENTTPRTAPFLLTQETPDTQAKSQFEHSPLYSKKDKKKQEKQKKKDEKEKKLQEEKERQEKLIEDMKQEKQKKKDEKERKQREEKERQEKLIEDMKKEKQRKKDEKEKKHQEEKDKQEKLIEDMKRIKKEKKEKPKKEKKEKAENLPPETFIQFHKTSKVESSKQPSLFQALSKKTEDPEQSEVTSFVPFSKKKEVKTQESSRLRIIPNTSEKELSPTSFLPTQSAPFSQTKNSKSAGKETTKCKQCGSVLSSDYMFCNKCGTQL